MLPALEALALLLTAVAMALPLAHALELPGKLRLDKHAYLEVQPIYYPGFTIGGLVGEVGALVMTAVLAMVTTRGSIASWLALGSFVAFAGMHVAYWVLTHPVNGFWLAEAEMGGAGARFFATDPLGRDLARGDWVTMRDRWERSQVIRSVLGVVGFVLVVTAVVI